MSRHGHILAAEDDPDDQLLLRSALTAAGHDGGLTFVENGEELLEYLEKTGRYSDSPTPRLVLLDLNMPRMDGRAALLAIKQDPRFLRIPVVVLTTSRAPADVALAYGRGANTFVSKPAAYADFTKIIRTLHTYWMEAATLPDGQRPACAAPEAIAALEGKVRPD